MKFNFDDAVSYLYSIPKFTKKNSMDHTLRLMKRLGNPEKNMKVIHVAGSNGKGSVCSYIYNVMLEAGMSTGLFTSPHLVDLRERFQVNGGLVSYDTFLDSFGTVYELAEIMKEEGEAYPTFFEFIFAVAMLIFKREKVEYVVLETGLGGRLDATNSVEAPVLTIITSISLEHTEILGDTIHKIAGEKAGIIKRGVPLVYDMNNEEAAEVIQKKAEEMGCQATGVSESNISVIKINKLGIDFSLFSDYDKGSLWHLGTTALYQPMNAALAITALRFLAVKDQRLIKDYNIINRGISNTFWPGRMQQIDEDIYFDGAHNASGIEQFTKTVQVLCENDSEKPLLLFSMVKEKDFRQSAILLNKQIAWDRIVLTSNPSDRSLSPDTLLEVFKEVSECSVETIDDFKAAYKYILKIKKPGQKIFCTGSLYFIGALMSELKEDRDD